MNSQETRSNASLIQIDRLVWVYALVLLWILAIGARIVYLQVFEVDKYRTQARDQQSGFVELRSRRGEILDRRLEELAISVRADSLFAQPSKVKGPAEAAHLLAPILSVTPDEIYGKLISRRDFAYIARKLEAEQVRAIQGLKLPGFEFEKESKRVYPGRELGAHLLGFVGLENEGLSGLEYLYNDQLKGSRAKILLRVNARRESLERSSEGPPADGDTLILNIDRSIQFTTEQVLKETVESCRALNGSAIVMDPNNGEILSMASYPAFDPNQFGNSSEEARRNRAILEIYEPGSTFKIVTIGAVLNEGLARPDEFVDCRVGTLRLAGKVYREAKHSYGTLTVNQILAKSSNVGTIKLGLRLGEEKLYEYIGRFGFGSKSGVELPGEQTGLLRPPSEWSRISIGAISIGQEIGITPIQMLRAMSVVANGGYLVQPHLVRQIMSSHGDLKYRAGVQRTRILHHDTVMKMQHGMGMVVSEGTGKTARLNGYSSAGKTGTAQKFMHGHYSREKYVASYVGFAPLNDARLAAIVVINEPKGQYYGGLVAAPAFARIMNRALLSLGVPQDMPRSLEDETVGPRKARKPRADVAENEEPNWSEEGLEAEDLEQTVLSLMEDKPVAEPATNSVTVNTNWFELPDFTGWSLRDVAREGARLGLRIKVSGSGTAVAQRPSAGSRVLRDTVCEVFFATEPRKADGTTKTGLDTAAKVGKDRKRSSKQS